MIVWVVTAQAYCALTSWVHQDGVYVEAMFIDHAAMESFPDLQIVKHKCLFTLIEMTLFF